MDFKEIEMGIIGVARAIKKRPNSKNLKRNAEFLIELANELEKLGM